MVKAKKKKVTADVPLTSASVPVTIAPVPVTSAPVPAGKKRTKVNNADHQQVSVLSHL